LSGFGAQKQALIEAGQGGRERMNKDGLAKMKAWANGIKRQNSDIAGTEAFKKFMDQLYGIQIHTGKQDFSNVNIDIGAIQAELNKANDGTVAARQKNADEQQALRERLRGLKKNEQAVSDRLSSARTGYEGAQEELNAAQSAENEAINRTNGARDAKNAHKKYVDGFNKEHSDIVGNGIYDPAAYMQKMQQFLGEGDGDKLAKKIGEEMKKAMADGVKFKPGLEDKLKIDHQPIIDAIKRLESTTKAAQDKKATAAKDAEIPKLLQELLKEIKKKK
jgi:multidrug efflux pump subunit AcrA (membrane-fusion protein)